MDELDKLKSDWKKKENTYPRFSENEIYAMLHKKSSSIVKWILIISVMEFAFWGLGSLISSALGSADYKPPKFIVILDYINYVVLVAFIIIFYINYRKISTQTPVKELLNNIITVRQVVKFYVVYNLCVISLSLLCGLFMYESDHSTDKYNTQVLIFGTIVIIFIILFIVFLYNILYGRLVRKLNKNYVELEKIKNI